MFGSSGPDSFDCSGLVYYCLRQAGLNIGRLNAAGYSNYAGWQRIDGKENLIRGDLVFFYDDAYSRISHVGVYLGNSSFLHASATAGSVVISNAGNWFNTHWHGADGFFKFRQLFRNCNTDRQKTIPPRREMNVRGLIKIKEDVILA